MKPSRPVVIVLGMVGQMPLAGVTWQVMHYLEGLRRLGCEVYYVEDTGEWPYDPEQNAVTDNPGYTTRYLARILEWCGLPGRWAYRAAVQNDCVFGLSESQFAELFKRADALVNVTGGTVLREEHRRVPVRIFLETDPVRPQIEVAKGKQFTIDLLRSHTHHFSFGENLGAPDCGVPVGPFRYRPTRQPVVIEWWQGPANQTGQTNSEGRFTTISNWKQTGKDEQWNGETYLWSKHMEFLKFIELPRCTAQPLELALACGDSEVLNQLASHGWHTSDAFALSLDIFPYRDYIRRSRGEFTVAKDQYVRLRSGWFSDRSACYLAAGKPVITQDTGFGKFLPTGRGLFAFQTMEDVLTAFDAIASDYDGHCRAARQIAEEHFAAEKVVVRLLDDAGL